jgi:hypothetical protein
MNKERLIDLNTLKGLQLGPKWENGAERKEMSKSDRGIQKKKKRNSTRARVTKYQNKFYINAFPNFKVINDLLNKVKKVGITYELKEIYDVFINDKNKLNYKISWKETEKFFYVTNLNRKIFENKRELITYIMQNHIEDLFEKRVIENDGKLPKFQSMLKCPNTSKLLPPQSYHEFRRYILEHMHENRIITEFDKYCNSLEISTDTDLINQFQNDKRINVTYTKAKEPGKFYSLIDINNDIQENKNGFYFKKQKELKLDYDQIKAMNFNLEINLKDLEIKNLLYTNIIVALKRAGFYLIKIKKRTYVTWVKNKRHDLNVLSILSKSIIHQIKKNKVTKKKNILELDEIIKSSKANILLEIKFLRDEGFLREFSDSTIMIA